MTRYPITELWREVTDGRRRVVFVPVTEPHWKADFFDWPMSYDNFQTGPSDYDTPSDQIYCPCQADLAGWDGSAGELLRMIHDHCARAGHPQPRHEP